MPSGSYVCSVQPLEGEDVVAAAQCIAIDAEAFPYASAPFVLHSASTYVWVAREPGYPQVLGFVATRARVGVMHIDGLAVDTKRRRQGVARTLLREVIEISRARGMHSLTLRVSTANRAAIALYVSEGFIVEGRLHRFYPAAAFGGDADAYAMVKHL